MADRPCGFVWHELGTTDPKAAAEFYGHVVGWKAMDAGMPDIQYTLLQAGDRQVAGVFDLAGGSCEGEARPGWIGYVGVADLNATLERIRQAGGSVNREPVKIPSVGTIAYVADPHGATFALLQPERTEAPPPSPPDAPGHVGWNELHAGDGPSAFEFYSSLFGWTKADAMDMGPLGVYQIFSAGAAPVGGMMTKMKDTPAATWVYYFNVDSASAAIERVKAHGGRLVMGPEEVPGPMWIAQFLDPQGGPFAVVAAKP